MPAPGSPTARVMKCELDVLAIRSAMQEQGQIVGRVVKAAQRQSEIIQQLFGLINQQNEKIKKMEGIIDDLVESVGGIETYVQEKQSAEQYAKLGID